MSQPPTDDWVKDPGRAPPSAREVPETDGFEIRIACYPNALEPMKFPHWFTDPDTGERRCVNAAYVGGIVL